MTWVSRSRASSRCSKLSSTSSVAVRAGSRPAGHGQGSRCARCRPGTAGSRRRRVQQIRCRDTHERYKVDTVLIAVDPASRRLERQPRLADTARPDERQQAAVRLVEHAIDRGELVGPPHERGARSRKVPDPRLERVQRRELGGEPADLELKDAFRDAQVLEAVRAEVAHVGVDERPRGLRQEHLPSVTDGRDPGCLVDVEADVPLVVSRARPCAAPSVP